MIHREGPDTDGFNRIHVGGLLGVYCVASVRGATLIDGTLITAGLFLYFMAD